jgi:hypothetical protein
VDCRLHSHEVSYGSGDGSSGQQSITCYPGNEDPNGLWIVKAPTGQVCPKGKIVKKGDVIRLQHAKTRLNLHAHNHKSPLTRQVEVSCYGPNGFGDDGTFLLFPRFTSQFSIPFLLRSLSLPSLSCFELLSSLGPSFSSRRLLAHSLAQVITGQWRPQVQTYGHEMSRCD